MIGTDTSLTTATQFFGVLAYPSDGDRAAYFCECVFDLRDNQCSDRRRRDAEKQLRLANGIIFDKRVPAGRILQWLLLGSGLFTTTVKEPIGVRTCCARLADELNARPKEDRRRKNGIRWTRERVIQEIWSPSKPVIHYAYALAFHADRRVLPTSDVRDFILRPTWLTRVMAEANATREHINAAPNIRIDHHDLIRDLYEAGDLLSRFDAAEPPTADRQT